MDPTPMCVLSGRQDCQDSIVRPNWWHPAWLILTPASAVKRKHALRGVYGLFDRASPNCIRYVGVSDNAAKRLWSHRNSVASLWAQLDICGVLLEAVPADKDREYLLQREQNWIYVIRGGYGADLNRAVYPWLV